MIFSKLLQKLLTILEHRNLSICYYKNIHQLMHDNQMGYEIQKTRSLLQLLGYFFEVRRLNGLFFLSSRFSARMCMPPCLYIPSTATVHELVCICFRLQLRGGKINEQRWHHTVAFHPTCLIYLLSSLLAFESTPHTPFPVNFDNFVIFPTMFFTGVFSGLEVQNFKILLVVIVLLFRS